MPLPLHTLCAYTRAIGTGLTLWSLISIQVDEWESRLVAYTQLLVKHLKAEGMRMDGHFLLLLVSVLGVVDLKDYDLHLYGNTQVDITTQLAIGKQRCSCVCVCVCVCVREREREREPLPSVSVTLITACFISPLRRALVGNNLREGRLEPEKKWEIEEKGEREREQVSRLLLTHQSKLNSPASRATRLSSCMTIICETLRTSRSPNLNRLSPVTSNRYRPSLSPINTCSTQWVSACVVW